MKTLTNHIHGLFPALVLVVICAPGLAAAETDYDVTMRMVADEEALDSSFVQEMQIPDSLNELGISSQDDALDAGELSSESLDMVESLSSEARETRDALDLELPGENLLDPPAVDLPGTDLPDPELPVEELPDTGLDLLNDTTSSLDSSVD